MQTLKQVAALLMVPLIAYLGAACDKTDKPTEASAPEASFHGGSNDDDDGGNDRLRAVPFVFIGTAAECAPSPAGSRIVTSAWLGGMGLPDNGGSNVGPTERKDPHRGLLLSKNGTTPNCSSSGARIRGVRGMVFGATPTLGFDYRNGGHCGGGAPRFNVTVKSGSTETFHFVGNCATGVATGAPQDPLEWTQLRFSAASQFPPIPPGSKIQSISILFDEGTDQPGVEDPRGVGLAVIDNIFIDGELIRRGSGIADGPGGQGGQGGDD